MKPISFSELLDKITEGEISKEQMVAIRPLIDDYMRMNTSVTSEIKFVLETNQLYLDQYSENPYMDDWMASTASCSGYETANGTTAVGGTGFAAGGGTGITCNPVTSATESLT